ncbi:MAG: cryptochrome/photolyase family protein [Verrucomicrobiia bacterium]
MFGYWILGDQLGPDHPALQVARKEDVFVLVESLKRAGHLRYHRHKLVLLFSAMRHRAEELRREGREVFYASLGDHPGGGYAEALKGFVQRYQPEALVVMEPNEWDTLQMLPALSRKIGVPIRTLPNRQFLLAREEFAEWAAGRSHLLMEQHYRKERRRLGYLLDAGGNPEGGAWNYDAANRRGVRDLWKEKVAIPEVGPEQADQVTREVVKEVAQAFPSHRGDPTTFWLPVTRERARVWLERFIRERLGHFGPYEDVMVAGQPVLFHSVLSPLLNLGLLTPKECADAAERAYREGRVPLASAEGFIRQIIGWREFVRGVYWLKMPEYRDRNALGADRPLPRWLEDGATEMRCVGETVRQAVAMGYNHHIQRLMVLGNYFLLGGYEPKAVVTWYLEMYVDAYDWVMQPNVLGMVLHADGGLFATKPYAAGAAYLSRMGNYCEGCRFRPEVKTGPDACPFHALYWNFFARNRERFRKNPRVGMVLKTLERMSREEVQRIRREAERFLDRQG